MLASRSSVPQSGGPLSGRRQNMLISSPSSHSLNRTLSVHPEDGDFTFDSYFFEDDEQPPSFFDNHYIEPMRKLFPAEKDTILNSKTFGMANQKTLPLLYLLDRQHYRAVARHYLNCFLHWKELTFEDQPQFFGSLSEHQETLRTVADEAISDVQMLTVWDDEINEALEKLCLFYDNYHLHRRENRTAALRESFNKFKSYSLLSQQVEKSLPLTLQVLLAVHHRVLWEVFCQYCHDKRRLVNLQTRAASRHSQRLNENDEITGSNPMASAAQSSSSPTRSRDGQQQQQSLHDIQVIYRQPLLSEEELWTMLRDCHMCPTLFGRRQLVKLMQETMPPYANLVALPRSSLMSKANSGNSNSSSSNGNFGSRKTPSTTPSGKGGGGKSSFKSPVKPASVASSSSDSSTAITIIDKEKVLIVTFNAFIKLLWRIAADLLNTTEDQNLVRMVKKIVRRKDRKSVNASVQLVNRGQWRKFLKNLDHVV